jgi:hypothetical protein
MELQPSRSLSITLSKPVLALEVCVDTDLSSAMGAGLSLIITPVSHHYRNVSDPFEFLCAYLPSPHPSGAVLSPAINFTFSSKSPQHTPSCGKSPMGIQHIGFSPSAFFNPSTPSPYPTNTPQPSKARFSHFTFERIGEKQLAPIG